MTPEAYEEWMRTTNPLDRTTNPWDQKIDDQPPPPVDPPPPGDEIKDAPLQGWLNFAQAKGMTDPDELLKGFGIFNIDDEMRGMVQGFSDQYGWKTSQMAQNMYAGVGQAMGQAGSALGQMREHASSLASQSGIRRGRGGMQSPNIYDQYQQGITGMRQKQQQGVEGLRHQWYDELTSTMAAIKADQEG